MALMKQSVKFLIPLKQLHFHTTDNKSFLRFHRPDKYGDDLTGIRHTVEYVNKDLHLYQKDIEVREDAGTPPILQLIRASLAYQLRNEIGFDFIKDRKNELKEYFISELKEIPNCEIY
jgi:hypothetical protein